MNNLNNLQQRVLTALLGAVLIVGSVVIGPWTYGVMFLLITILTQWEFYQLVGLDGNLPLRYYGTFCSAALFTVSFLVESQVLPNSYFLLLFPLASFIFLIKLYKRNETKPFTNIAFTFLGIVYVGMPFALFNLAVFQEGEYRYYVGMGGLFLLWASDTGAYFAGTTFGKTKLFERVSPKKSWEGSVGGALMALMMASILAYFFEGLSLWQWYVMAAIIVVAGTYGDLVESLFKRSMSIKDSGRLIPGHGGFLDRFDGLLLAFPFLAAFLELIVS